ncbi:hypothetical protein NN6n1_21190 [Shinella zoogloeoides]
MSGRAHLRAAVVVYGPGHGRGEPGIVEAMDDAKRRAARLVGAELECHDAFEMGRFIVADPVTDLLAGDRRDRRGIGKPVRRQPPLAKGGNADRPPYLVGRRVEFVFEIEAGGRAVGYPVAHWSMSFSKSFRASIRAGQ